TASARRIASCPRSSLPAPPPDWRGPYSRRNSEPPLSDGAERPCRLIDESDRPAREILFRFEKIEIRLETGPSRARIGFIRMLSRAPDPSQRRLPHNAG